MFIVTEYAALTKLKYTVRMHLIDLNMQFKLWLQSVTGTLTTAILL